MGTVAISVQLNKYQATVHYETCRHYRDTYHHSKLALPPSIRWHVCKVCRPTPEDVAAVAREVTWVEKSADVMDVGKNLGSGMLVMWSEDIERHLVEGDLYGRSNFTKERY